MVVGALDLKTVTLRPDLLWMEQPLDMTLFRITHQVTNVTCIIICILNRNSTSRMHQHQTKG